MALLGFAKGNKRMYLVSSNVSQFRAILTGPVNDTVNVPDRFSVYRDCVRQIMKHWSELGKPISFVDVRALVNSINRRVSSCGCFSESECLS
jgi:hypothetical protein